MSYEYTGATTGREERLVRGEALVLNTSPGGNVWHWVPPYERTASGVKNRGRQAKCGSNTYITWMNSRDPNSTKEFGPQCDINEITCKTCAKKYEDYCVRVLKGQIDRYYSE